MRKLLANNPEFLAFFQKAGRKGGLLGGKISASHMTPEQRSARAKKAAETRWAKRRKKPPAP